MILEPKEFKRPFTIDHYVRPLQKIIFDYYSLKQRLDNPDQQSWYFIQGLESSKKKLITLKNSYEDIRNEFNVTSIETYKKELKKLKKTNENNQRYIDSGEYIGFMKGMFFTSVKSQIGLLDETLKLKLKIGKLEPIEYYQDKLDNLNEIFQ